MCPDLNYFLRPRGRVSAEDISQRLREMSPELPPPYGWEEFRRRGRNRSRFNVKWTHAAAAAGLVAVIGATALIGHRHYAQDDAVSAPKVVELANGKSLHLRGGENNRAAAGGRETREWLARQPVEPAVAPVVSRIAVADLEDRIAWFDDALTDVQMQGVSADRLEVLQQERARLVSSLAQVRYAEALAAGGS